MKINRLFRRVRRGYLTIICGYPNKNAVNEYIAKWGGDRLDGLTVPKSVEEYLLDENADLYSYMTNGNPRDSSTYTVAVRRGDHFYSLAYFEKLSQANDFAKEILPNEEAVIVVKRLGRKPEVISDELMPK